MGTRQAKKLRKYTRLSYFEYLAAIKSWPFTVRVRLCWHILFDRKRPYRS